MPDAHPPRGPARTIAIDGPAASGKSAVGARVAERLGYRFVDTGAMYRAITWAALQRNIDVNDAGALTSFAEHLRIEVHPDGGETHVVVNAEDVTAHLRTQPVEENVSLVSRVPGVRATLVRIQRELARPGDIVVAGRDIGSVVLPDAPLKVYLDASREVRAARRAAQMRAAGEPADLGAILRDLERRDGIDRGREVSPLTAAPGAVIIETDDLTIDEAVNRIVELAR